ncbi:MAG TPA: hypothetical protein VHT51_00825, partial [Micropepsaceae bacterium]|nr:hypothetical protein [Micropepsaceae bacterium]
MRHAHAVKYAAGIAILAVAAICGESFAQGTPDPNSAPQTYREDPGWAKLTEGRKWCAVSAVDIDRDGKSVWVFDR